MERIFPVLEKNLEALTLKQKISASFEKADFNEKVEEDIFERLILLEKESKFNEDSRKIERGMQNVFDLLEKKYANLYPQLKLTDEQKKEGRIAAILHDIGKTGPTEAGEEERKTIVKIFAQEQIKSSIDFVEKVISEKFSAEESAKMLEDLKNCGVDSQMTMRQFWDKHAQWTHDILEKYPLGLNRHIRTIAGSHHIDHGINPYNLSLSEIPLQSVAVGIMEDYADILEERVLIAMDKYEASIRRSNFNHKQAIAWVRNDLNNSKNFKDDKIIKLICDAIDELGAKQLIFS